MLILNLTALLPKIIGNLKSRPVASVVTERLIDRPYLLLASSHADEELALVDEGEPETDLFGDADDAEADVEASDDADVTDGDTTEGEDGNDDGDGADAMDDTDTYDAALAAIVLGAC